MASIYKQFLASPNSSLLSDNASLYYVTTTTSFHGAAEIIKHLNNMQKHLKKKKEDVLNIVEGDTAAALEFDTGIEFLISGGPYLPGLDDNFVADRVVYLPMTHFVSTGSDGKISQIRISWDQGALLKQIEVIGKTGRNWPIKDSREQITMIQSCVKAVGAASTASTQSQKEMPIRNRGNSNNAIGDPHATLHMQPTREELEEESKRTPRNPYAGKKQSQRGFTDILGDQPEGEENSRSAVSANPYAGKKQPQRGFADILGDNPQGAHYDSRNDISPAKTGASRNHQSMRIFEAQQDDVDEEEPPRNRANRTSVKPDPRLYSHFDFADGSDPSDAPKAGVDLNKRPKSKHDSQWSFDDFVSPSKPQPSRAIRAQEVRHWDTDTDAPGQETPIKPPGKGRRDAETHFELQDDGEEVIHQDRAYKRASRQNDNQRLYSNRLFDEGEPDADSERALGNITNLKGRGNDFDAHWTMTDDPQAAPAPGPEPINANRKKAVKMMDANWSNYDESPKQNKFKENVQQSKDKDPRDTGIFIAGDGMGGRKGTNRDWFFGGGE